jgi:hypothetical protein
MSNQSNTHNWHLLADRFIWYDDLQALSHIPQEVTNEEIQKYLYTFHGDAMDLQEIQSWREKREIDKN